MMRVITGTARGIKLAAPDGEHTRPTAERVKEAVFSMLQFEIEGRRVLDLFAGSGQLGIEALSRGAAHAVFVDQSKEAVAILKQNLFRTKLALQGEIICADYGKFLRASKNRRGFDLIFLDPPYAMGAVPEALEALLSGDLLIPGAILACETAKPEDVFGGKGSLAGKFTVRREAKYGAAYVTLLTLREEEPT